MATIKQKILIIGASRGIGLGLAREYLSRGWSVIATERKFSSSSALSQLAHEYHDALRVELIDINQPEQISALYNCLKSEIVDILYINAGVMTENNQSVDQISTDAFNHLMLTNVLSPLRVIERLAGLVKVDGTIAVMSSLMGSISENTTGGADAYRASKAALNALLRSYALRAGDQRTLLALHPGWVKTDMGGADAPIDVAESVKGLADTIELRSKNAGLYFADFQNRSIAW